MLAPLFNQVIDKIDLKQFALPGRSTTHALVYVLHCILHRRKMSAHALLKMTRDLFRAMALALRQKCPGNVEMKGALAAFFGSDSVAISCYCKRSKIILVKVSTEVCSLENITS